MSTVSETNMSSANGAIGTGGGVTRLNITSNTNAIALGARRQPRMNLLSEMEKRARHNAHTRSSRLRVDKGLNRLKEILKKARPELKLNKKADVVDAAYDFIQDAMAHLREAAPPALPYSANNAHHDVNESS